MRSQALACCGGSIAWDRMVDFHGPGVNTTDQVFDIGEALLKQESRGVGAAHPFVA